jgi:hypothetical protein
MDTTIIAQVAPTDTPVVAPVIRYYRITPIILHTSRHQLAIADGVVEVDGAAWLGQVQTDPDTGAWQVAAIVDAQSGYAWRAPVGWQADTLQRAA